MTSYPSRGKEQEGIDPQFVVDSYLKTQAIKTTGWISSRQSGLEVQTFQWSVTLDADFPNEEYKSIFRSRFIKNLEVLKNAKVEGFRLNPETSEETLKFRLKLSGEITGGADACNTHADVINVLKHGGGMINGEPVPKKEK